MVNKTYTDYIKSERWKAICRVYWAKVGRKCQACGATNKGLHVHHMTYERFGAEALTDLIGLCYPCHKEVHRLHRKSGRKNLRMVTLGYVQRVRIKAKSR